MQSVCILAQDQYGNYVIQVFQTLGSCMPMVELRGFLFHKYIWIYFFKSLLVFC